jgi:hypothetical protein
MIFADIGRVEILMDGVAKFFRANFNAYPTNATEFYKLAAKLIPIQVGSDIESPLMGTVIQIVPDPNCHRLLIDEYQHFLK